jgi:F-box/leucine-rich repeat protein 2/20
VLEVTFTTKWCDAEDPTLNKITSYIATFCPILRSFRGDRSHRHEALADIAGGCPLLEELLLPGGFTDETIDAFARTCRLLKRVKIESDDAFAQAPLLRLLRNGRCLESITINGDETELTDMFFVTLAQCCPLLAKVDIFRADISEVSMEALAAGCPKLQSLSLSCGSIELSRLRGAAVLPALTHLCLWEEEIDDESFDVMLRYCPKLQTLALVQLMDLTEDGLESVSVYCPLLHTLSLTCCLGAATDAALRSLAGQCTQLRSFSAPGCEELTDDGIGALITAHPLLEELDVSDCWEMTDAVLYALVENCPQLRRVCVNRCKEITSAGVLALLQGCLHLTGVQVADCPLVKEDAKRLLEERFPR